MPFIAINWSKIEDCAPRSSGLHLGNVVYDNTLAAIADPGRRRDEEVRAAIGANPARSGRSGDDRWVIRKKIRQKHTLGS